MSEFDRMRMMMMTTMAMQTLSRATSVRVLRASGVCALAIGAGCLTSCRTGVFDNENPQWRVPEAELRRIDGIDPAASAIEAPITLEEAAKNALSEIAMPAAPASGVEVTLADVRAAVLANNLDLRTMLVDPAIARANLSAEEAKFENVFFAEYDRNSNSVFSDLATGAAADSDAFNAGLRIPLATGGSIDVSAPLTRAANGLDFGSNEEWLAAVSFSMSQPLLRGAGVDANTHSIRVANWQGQITDSRTKLEAIRILATAEKSYWNVYSSYRELGVRRAQYEVAQKQLERARRRVTQGDAPEIEVTRAESGIGRTLEQIIIADASLRIRQRALKRLMNREDLPVGADTPVKPATEANPVGLKLNGEVLATQAVAHRMEMVELELQLAIDQSEIGYRRNAALPLFVLDYGYNIQGLGSEVNEAYSGLGDADSFAIGVRAEIPMGNEAATNRVNAAILQRVQRLGTREARRQSIHTEVFDALDGLAQSWQRILAARLETILAARTLAGEERQFDVGLRTSTDVLDASASLADAQSREVQALSSYQIALIDLAFATGTSLGASRIRWEPFSIDELPALESLPGATEAPSKSGFTEEAAAPSTGSR